MTKRHLTSRLRRSDDRLDDPAEGRFTAYGIILGLGVFMALATALDLPAFGRANVRPLDLNAVSSTKSEAPVGPVATDPEDREDTEDAELAITTPAESEQIIDERHVTVRRGDTLMKVLRRAGADRQEANTAIGALKKIFDPRRLKVGQKLTAAFRPTESTDRKSTDDATLISVMVALDVERSVSAIRTEVGFQAQEIIQPLESSFVRGADRIDDSLFVSARRTGVP